MSEIGTLLSPLSPFVEERYHAAVRIRRRGMRREHSVSTHGQRGALCGYCSVHAVVRLVVFTERIGTLW